MIWGAHVFTYEEQREYLHACFSDKYALVQERILLGQPVDFKDEEGRTAMYLAAVESNSDIVKFLLENKGALFHLSNACARSEAAAGLKRLMRFFFGFDSSFSASPYAWNSDGCMCARQLTFIRRLFCSGGSLISCLLRHFTHACICAQPIQTAFTRIPDGPHYTGLHTMDRRDAQRLSSSREHQSIPKTRRE